MMMIAPNFLARQIEGVQREREEKEGDLRRGGQTETLTSGNDAHAGLSQGCQIRGTGENVDVGMGLSIPQERQSGLGISRAERVNAEMSLVRYHVKNLDKINCHGRCAEWGQRSWSIWDGNIIV